jgi:hypothetical protein
MVPPGADVAAPENNFYRPPLAKELFANRLLFIEALDHFPQCKTIVYKLRDPQVLSGTKSIETLLQEIEEEARTYTRGAQELAAIRCYLQRAITVCQKHWHQTTKGVTNYLSLLREIERTHKGNDPVCLVTFNYDTILESALEQLGHPIRGIEDYTRTPRLFRVFKPHGSINWARGVDIQLPGAGTPHSALTYLVEHVGRYRIISDSFELCDPSNMGVVDGRPVFPAIAVPVEKKNVFECPQHMIDDLTSALPDVHKIITIGWRATENHFLKLLREHLKRGVFLTIVAGNSKDAGEVKVHIHRALINNPPESIAEGTGFTDFMRGGRAVEVLDV